jgi:BirA family biotin operon repressor/biotin-[acetyl-CoA-carboxylase] ligase
MDARRERPLTLSRPDDPALPPLLTGHRVAASDDPAEFAYAGAAAGRFSAGDTCWSAAEDRAAAALVLEPECMLASALEMAPLMLVAVGDALGAIGPPNLAITYRWPYGVLANGGEAGRVSVRVPEGATLDAEPDFLVVGFSLAMTLPRHARKSPGRHVDITALHEEGCGDLDRTMVIEAVCRHFLSWVDGWEQGGFRQAHPVLVGRLSELNERVSLPGTPEGRLVGIEANCTALLDAPDRLLRIPLAEALGVCT